MSAQKINLHFSDTSQTTCSFPRVAKTLVITGIAIGGIAALTIGLSSHFHFITGINTLTQWTLIGTGSSIELALIISVIYRHRAAKKALQKKPPHESKKNTPVSIGFASVENRQPKGFLKSPYPPSSTLRFLANHVTNGRLSTINPDHKSMNLLNKEGVITLRHGQGSSSLKVVFLGDIMVSKSGNPPQLDDRMKKLLQSAQVIVANVEAPVVNSTQATKRGISLKFEMSNQYLNTLYAHNPTAQWVFSIANNHACDTSDQSEEDVSGVLTTIESIKTLMPTAEIIGAEIGTAKATLSLQIENGPKIGFLAWTEVMNNDNFHFRKKILRENDITEETIARTKSEHDILIGFPHGNEEQSYYPLKETRDRWCRLMGSDKFDVIVGHGPHVIHPAELVKERVLFHSIGNFCSPVGHSQTRLGCTPEIDLFYDQAGKPLQVHYKINLLEQRQETVSLLANIDESATIYPEIITRLRKIWGNLFSSNASQQSV